MTPNAQKSILGSEPVKSPDITLDKNNYTSGGVYLSVP